MQSESHQPLRKLRHPRAGEETAHPEIIVERQIIAFIELADRSLSDRR
jgi:hypothetical protein